MTWTNAFDLGACTVRVLSDGTPVYSGVLAKGTSSGNFADLDSDATLSVDVSAQGIVTLNRVSGEFGSWKRLDVIPLYSVAGLGLRASGIAMDSSFVDGLAFSSDENSDGLTLSTTDGGATWSPDPADVSALTPGHDGVSIAGFLGV